MADNQQESEAGKVTKHLFEHGCLSYVQIPAINAFHSADFYHKVFGWKVKGGSSDHVSFSDAADKMIGAWVTDRAISQDAGVLIYIYVHAINDVLDQIIKNGGVVLRPSYAEGDLWVATFRDPAGNEIGVWQQGDR